MKLPVHMNGQLNNHRSGKGSILCKQTFEQNVAACVIHFLSSSFIAYTISSFLDEFLYESLWYIQSDNVSKSCQYRYLNSGW
jgi:hypothetical protein